MDIPPMPEVPPVKPPQTPGNGTGDSPNPPIIGGAIKINLVAPVNGTGTTPPSEPATPTEAPPQPAPPAEAVGGQDPVDSGTPPARPEPAEIVQPPADATPRIESNSDPSLMNPPPSRQRLIVDFQAEEPVTVELSAPGNDDSALTTIVKELRERIAAQSVAEERELKLRTGAAATVTGALSSLYLLWIFRGGALLASLLTSLPVWRMIDPLPILPGKGATRLKWSFRRRKKKDAETDLSDQMFGS
jgi:hypothetical protein